MPPARRLDPSVFGLPVGRLRDGWYSDAYFTFTKDLLEAEDRHPHALRGAQFVEPRPLRMAFEAVGALLSMSAISKNSSPDEWLE